MMINKGQLLYVILLAVIDYAANETSSYIVDSILHIMRIKHLSV